MFFLVFVWFETDSSHMLKKTDFRFSTRWILQLTQILSINGRYSGIQMKNLVYIYLCFSIYNIYKNNYIQWHHMYLRARAPTRECI